MSGTVVSAGGCCLHLFAMIVFSTVAVIQLAGADKKTCFCEVNIGRDTFSEPLLDIEDPVIRGVYITCRKAALWCPSACYKAAKKRLLNGGEGDVSPLTGQAGQTACALARLNVSSSTSPQLHLYATYRISHCGYAGFRYLGRLCCWQYSVGADFIYKFNEGCMCGPKPACDQFNSTPVDGSTTPTIGTTDMPTTAVLIP